MWALDALKNSIFITGLVMIMMILIEYTNVFSNGATLEKLSHRPYLQIILSALLGLIPGCAGGFAVVSLYAHNIVSFGALIAMLICTIGDDGIVMLAMVPKTAVTISLVLFATGTVAGFICDKFIKLVPRPFEPSHFHIHSEKVKESIWAPSQAFKQFSWKRIIILAGTLLFAASLILGITGHQHATQAIHIHEHHHEELFSHEVVNYLFGLLALLGCAFILFSSTHFVEEHIWDHIVKHHFPTIFLWTAGTLLVIGFTMQFVDIASWIKEQYWFTLIIALLVGIIPQSGPNLVFISLFAQGSLPTGILLANSIVQDGHASLPLLAETKKGFLLSKALKICLAALLSVTYHFLLVH